MDLQPYLGRLGVELDRVTSLADDQTRDLSRRLVAALEPGLRLAMTELLADACAELTAGLGGPVVTLRMDGSEPVLQVTDAPVTEATAPQPPAPEGDSEDGTARVTVRLPDGLKRRAEASAQHLQQSLNTWIVQAIRAASEGDPARAKPPIRTGRHLTGWA